MISAKCKEVKEASFNCLAANYKVFSLVCRSDLKLLTFLNCSLPPFTDSAQCSGYAPCSLLGLKRFAFSMKSYKMKQQFICRWFWANVSTHTRKRERSLPTIITLCLPSCRGPLLVIFYTLSKWPLHLLSSYHLLGLTLCIRHSARGWEENGRQHCPCCVQLLLYCADRQRNSITGVGVQGAPEKERVRSASEYRRESATMRTVLIDVILSSTATLSVLWYLFHK